MTVRGRVLRSAYHDSAALMRVQQALRSRPGIEEAGVVMATPANLDLLRQAGLDPAAPAFGAAGTAASTPPGPNDLVVMVRGRDAADLEAALASVDDLLARRPEGPAAAHGYHPRTVSAAARMLPGANLALISVPGRLAAGVAREALQAGLHVMLFSDNVSLDDELSLKQTARAVRRLVMGPDCGTAVLGGAALGFANRVRRGGVGLIGASGTGIQEVAVLVHRLGAGVSQAIGTGGRDLSAEVGGATTRRALAVLGRDSATRVVVLISKPPAPQVAAALLKEAASLGKPVVAIFTGAGTMPGAPGVRQIHTLEDAARAAAGGGQALLADDREVLSRIAAAARAAAGALGPSQRYLRGAMSGGTLCAEAVALLEGTLRPLFTNVASGRARRREGAGPGRAHTILDLGDDVFTAGRLHPMLDMTLRAARLRQDAADPEVAVLLLDVVLGLGVHPDPAGALAPAIEAARADARAAGRHLVAVASVCGTDDDPQHRGRQAARLRAAGVLVEESNARAALLAGAVAARVFDAQALAAMLKDAAAGPVPAGSAPEAAAAPPDRGGAVEVSVEPLLAGPRVVNVGLEMFAGSLSEQRVPVVHVDWRPPAGGDPELADLLERLT
jgi:FdrA protein